MSQITDDIKKLLDPSDIDENRSDNKLHHYIVSMARKELNGKEGGLPDNIVLGWARHFYQESQETIDNEIGKKASEPKKSEQVSKPKPKAPKPDDNQLSLFDSK